jgi:hypothetical protein
MIGRGDIPVTVSTSPAMDLSVDAHRARLRKGLRLAGVPENLSDSEFAAKNKLTAEEIRPLIFGKRLHGRTFDTGEDHTATIAADGLATLSGDWASLGGGTMEGSSVRFETDELCFVWQNVVKLCGPVFRNPGAPKAKENEFIWYHGDRAFTFSQAD